MSTRAAEADHAEPGGFLSGLAGRSDRVLLGPAELFEVHVASGRLRCHHRPWLSPDSAYLAILLQVRGLTLVRQDDASHALREGDLCLINEDRAVDLVYESRTRLVLLRMPRTLASAYFTGIEGLSCSPLRLREPGVALLGDLLRRAMAEARALTADQRLALLGSLVQLLGAVERIADLAMPSREPRVCRALAFIEMRLGSADLTADGVALEQRVTRRHLDQLMVRELGRTVHDQLLARRLERACADLHNPACRALSITQIARGSGFADAGHFARAFKRVFLMPPTVWRARNRLR